MRWLTICEVFKDGNVGGEGDKISSCCPRSHTCAEVQKMHVRQEQAARRTSLAVVPIRVQSSLKYAARELFSVPDHLNLSLFATQATYSDADIAQTSA
jgi:hypothetical protein